MTRREAERLTHQENTLLNLGFSRLEAEQLRRISMTLRRWYEKECGIDGGGITRDEKTGKAFWHNSFSGKLYPIADREKGAEKRLEAIMATRNNRVRVANAIGDVLGPATSNLRSYLQTDPRGAALYILRPGDVPEGGDEQSYYSRGICIY